MENTHYKNRTEEEEEEENGMKEACSFSCMVVQEGDKVNRDQNTAPNADFAFAGGESVSTGDEFPADFFFYKGKILPHEFPFPSKEKIKTHKYFSDNSNKSPSLTSSNDSRSSSNNSSDSSSTGPYCNSLRSFRRIQTSNKSNMTTKQDRLRLDYNSFLIMSTPCVIVDRRRSFSKEPLIRDQNTKLRQRKSSSSSQSTSSSSSWFGERMLKSLVTTCKELHAIEPSKKSQF